LRWLCVRFYGNFSIGSPEGLGIARCIGQASGTMQGARQQNVRQDNNIITIKDDK